MLQEYQIRRTREIGLAHPFFEVFPFLREPFTRQIVFWCERGLMVQNNVARGGAFVLDFMREENDELGMAVKDNKLPEIHDEAADVGIVSFIAPAFVAMDGWMQIRDEVIGLVSNAITISGLNKGEYARHVSEVIMGKNRLNHPPAAYARLPYGVDQRTMIDFYNLTRATLKAARYKFPDQKMPSEAGVVLRLNGKTERTKYATHVVYKSMLEDYSTVINRRNEIVASL